MNIGVIGAGAAGLMAAWRLARAGHRVTVIEREPAVGGLAVNFAVGGGQIERYYHHIFKTDTRIIRLIDELGLGNRMIWGHPPTAVRYNGGTYRLDSPLNVMKFTPLSIPDRLRLGLAVGYLKALPNPDPLEPYTASEWLQRWMGKRVYQVVWEPQLRGKLGEHADEVAMAWFWARIHDRTPALGYLRYGFGQVYERLAEEIRKRGGTVRVGERVDRIGRDEQGPAIVTPAGTERFDHLVITLPTSLFLRLAPDLPAWYRDHYQRASLHYGAHNVVLGIDRQVQWSYWLSVAEPGYPFLVLVEHTNFLPPEDYGGLRVLYLGNYLPQDHRLFGMDDEATLSELLPAITKLNPAFNPGWVKEATVNRAPFAQPIVTRGYRDRQPPFETPWPDVWLANMGQVYPHDRGQNYSLILGEQVARRVHRTGLVPRRGFTTEPQREHGGHGG